MNESKFEVPAKNGPKIGDIQSHLAFLARDSFIYGIAGAINKSMGLITFPMLAHYFSPYEYGVFDLFNVGVVFWAVFFVFGQDSAVARFFFEYPDLQSKRQIVSQSLFLQIFILAVGLPLLWFFLRAHPLGIEERIRWVTLLCVAQLPFFVLVNFSQNILKWTFDRTRFLIVSLGSSSMSAVGVALVILFEGGMVEIFAVFLVVRCVFACVGIFHVRKWLTLPTLQHLQEMCIYAAPCGIIGAIAALAPGIERTFIATNLDAPNLGVFAAGAKIASLVILPVHAFKIAWGPFSLSIFRDADALITYNWVLRIFCIGVLIVVLLVSAVAAPLICLAASPEYLQAVSVVFPLAMVQAVQGIGSILESGIAFSKRSYLSLYSYLIFLASSVFLIWISGRTFGLVGVAWGALLAEITRAAVGGWFSYMAFPIRWAFRNVILAITLTVFWGLLIQLVLLWGGHMFASIIALVGACLLLMVFWCFFIDSDERVKLVRVFYTRYHWLGASTFKRFHS